MIFGAITNSWRLQLESRELIELVAEAEANGARHIELRQTCLGSLRVRRRGRLAPVAGGTGSGD